MSYACNSGNFSSQSAGTFLRYPVSNYNSFYPSSAIYSQRPQQLGSTFFGGQQESFSEPTDFESSGVEARTCFRPKNFIFSRPCNTQCTGSFGYGNSGFGSFGYGNAGFQSLGCGSSYNRPGFFSSKSYQSAYYQPTCGSRFFGSSY
ncbi:keratin-associated protein 15-1 [Perognathus longimembris pacificus]|uniref:keratin-associated protein 15-1 n=1 Tax=Perognathus longimembris pacificus TaxID=214514 RepID=UPI00201964BB|nr:keratin-associated protein 15-1 [Perognathus longimembris pacificus]